MNVKYFEPITLSQSKNFLHFNLMQKIANCLTDDQALGDNYQAQQAAFLAAFAQLDAALQISRKSMLTPAIQQLDKQRVQEWRLIYSATKESTKMTDETTVNAANFVLSLLNNHGEVPTMKVNERTGALFNLCQDLTERYAPQVEAIGLTSFATKLAATNAEYMRLYEQRLHEWSEYTNEAVLGARAATDETLENLCIMVASGIITSGMSRFKHFVDYVNEAIKVAKIAMGVPNTKPEGGDSEQEPGEDEDQQPEGGGQTPPAEQEPTTPPAGGGNNGSTDNDDDNDNTGGGDNGGFVPPVFG